MNIKLSALLLLVLGTTTAAQPAPEWDDLLPPALPWRGKSERLIAKSNDPWITPSEQENFVSTPDYATTRTWLDRLVASSHLFRIERYGTSVLGRELYAVIGSKDGATLDPAKPLVLVQAGIHSGEIDGKDAGLMLLRDIAFRGKGRLLDRANLLFVPILNPDGHENSSPYSRPNQRGPIWRANSTPGLPPIPLSLRTATRASRGSTHARRSTIRATRSIRLVES